MRSFKNEHNISEMRFTLPVTAYCPLGSDFYKAKVSCHIVLSDTIIDHADIRQYFMKELNGKKLTLEMLADEVYKTIKKEFQPEHIEVRVYNDVELPVEIVKNKD